MYCSGILEANAITGIKFRGPALLNLYKRNDTILFGLDKDLQEETKKNGMKSPRALELQSHIAKRSDEIKSSYRKAVDEFADLHDRHQRMKSVGAVQVR